MTSFKGYVMIALIVITFFQGMLIVFDNADKTNLNPDSQALYDTLSIQVDNVSPVDDAGQEINYNFTRDNPQLSDENAFSVEFFTASTSNQNKITQIDTMKATPYLISFVVGNQSDFSWFFNNIYWWISIVIIIIGFVIIFRREVQ